MTEHEQKFPLTIDNPNFFNPMQKVSITSYPTREQDVIALFNQLIAGGVIRGIKIMSTNERSTYDNLQELARQVLKISKEENDSNEVAVTYSLESAQLIEKGERYLGSVSYLVKNSKYDFEKAVVLLNEAIDLNNKAKNIRDLQKAADYFLKNCYNVGANYENR